MSVLENFKNIPRSPYGGATGLKCNFFFFKFATKSLEKKKEGGPAAPPNGRQAPVAHPKGDRVPCVNTANWNNCFRSFFSKILFRNSIVQANPLKPWPPFAAIPFVI